MDLTEDSAFQRLDPLRPYKPLDIGEHGVAASINTSGRLLVVTQGHPRHGALNLTSASAFTEKHRFDPDAVRLYRRRLSARKAASFGLRVDRTPASSSPAGSADSPSARLIESVIPVTRLNGSGAAIATFVPHPDDSGGIAGVIQVLDGAADVPLRWTGALRVERAPFPELTETHPLAALTTRSESTVSGDGVVVYAPDLEWAVAVGGDLASRPRVARRSDRIHVDVPLQGGGRIVALGLGSRPDEATDAAQHLASNGQSLLEAEVRRWQDRWSGWPTTAMDLVTRRGVSYVISCCAVPVGDTICLVTDHRILPLAWTRDGYFMARALLDWHKAGGPNEAVTLVRRHLAWLFEVAERPEGWWARSHMVGGQRKDLAFQLDQQLYPLVELADYIEVTGDREPLARFDSEINTVLEAIEARKADGACLYSTEESPQDDILNLPFETSNQILAWHAFERLHRIGFGGGRLRTRAEAIVRDIRTHQVIDTQDGKQRFAYATDLAGGAIDYHDANDMPMALAPAWGFCSAADPVWLETARFAFSPANVGFFTGPRGGLGSLHTPAPWPLGQAQAYMVGRSTGDREATEAAAQALLDAALWDGSLPEATDAGSGRPRSRLWFAWPAASATSAVLERRTGITGATSGNGSSRRGKSDRV